MKTEISINEKIRVNMGWQCPECSGVRVKDRMQYAYECQECGCNWDGSRYPLPSLPKR